MSRSSSPRRRWRARALGDVLQEPLQFSHDLHHRLRLGQLADQPLVLRPQPPRIVLHAHAGSMRPPRGRGATGHRITCATPLTDLGLVQALTTQHGSLAAVRCRLILRNHPRPVGRRERAPDRTSRRIYDYFSWAGHRIIFGTRKNWTIATHETVSYHHPPRWTRGLRGVSLQPDREGRVARAR